MQLIKQVIEEIMGLEKEPTHKSAMRICNLLENNRKLFLERIAPDDFNLLFSRFESIAHKRPGEHSTADYADDFKKSHQALSFYLNRII